MVNSLVCVRAKEGEREIFIIDGGYQCIRGWGNERRENDGEENGSEIFRGERG